MRPPILFAWFGLATFAGPSQATQLLHTLVSPNEQPSGHFGIGVSIVGDVDDDGHADVVVGASHEAPGTSPSYAGRAYVFSGQSAFLLFTLASPNEEANGFFGDDVSAAGDVNNDGYDDVVVGALGESPDGAPQGAGGPYVFSGQSGAVLHVLASPNQEYEGNFGISVSGGDVDNDDHADVIVGAWNEDPGAGAFDAGRAYVFSGQNGVLLHTLRSPTEQPEGHFGNSVSNAGDMDADGYGDVIVAAYQEDTDSTDAGKAYVFSGETGSLLCTLMSPNEEAHGLFGYSVSGGEDVDCDGYDDVIVGAPRENPGGSPHDAGRAYVFSG